MERGENVAFRGKKRRDSNKNRRCWEETSAMGAESGVLGGNVPICGRKCRIFGRNPRFLGGNAAFLGQLCSPRTAHAPAPGLHCACARCGTAIRMSQFLDCTAHASDHRRTALALIQRQQYACARCGVALRVRQFRHVTTHAPAPGAALRTCYSRHGATHAQLPAVLCAGSPSRFGMGRLRSCPLARTSGAVVIDAFYNSWGARAMSRGGPITIEISRFAAQSGSKRARVTSAFLRACVVLPAGSRTAAAVPRLGHEVAAEAAAKTRSGSRRSCAARWGGGAEIGRRREKKGKKRKKTEGKVVQGALCEALMDISEK